MVAATTDDELIWAGWRDHRPEVAAAARANPALSPEMREALEQQDLASAARIAKRAANRAARDGDGKATMSIPTLVSFTTPTYHGPSGLSWLTATREHVDICIAAGQLTEDEIPYDAPGLDLWTRWYGEANQQSHAARRARALAARSLKKAHPASIIGPYARWYASPGSTDVIHEVYLDLADGSPAEIEARFKAGAVEAAMKARKLAAWAKEREARAAAAVGAERAAA